MAELFLQIAVSLDGYIEAGDGDLEWMTCDPHFDPVATATLETVGGMIFGRKAHGLLAQFWPTADQTPDATKDLLRQAQLMRDLPKYVLTHGRETHGWENSHPLNVDGVARLKAASSKPIALFAGAGAAQTLLPLLDEVRLVQYPVLLGGGTRLFDKTGSRRQLRRISAREFPSGAVLTIDRFDR